MRRVTIGRVLGLLALLGALGLPRAAEPAEAGRIGGIDVSKYQHDTGQPINWRAVKASGQSFAFIKATGGSNRVDPWFHREWAAAKAAGMIRGAYHYADPSGSAVAQAALVVQTVGTTREANNLGIALDLESSGGLSPRQLSAWAHTFLREVERRTGRTPILYTYVNFWKTAMAGNRTFGAYPLWLARYSGTAPAPLPGWSRWTFWQHTSSSRIPGIPGYTDHNWMCCSSGTLAALADGRSREIAGLWRRLGGASGHLGLPLGPEVQLAGGWGQTFEKGFVATTRNGTHAVLGPVWERYRASGGAGGSLGVPRGASTIIGKVGGREVSQQLFVGGRILYSGATGAHVLRGGILDRWVAEGGLRSSLGLPVAEFVRGGQQFTGGGLYAAPSGARLVPGRIRDRYEELGGPTSPLGWPTAEPQPLADLGVVVVFERGQLMLVRVGDQDVVI